MFVPVWVQGCIWRGLTAMNSGARRDSPPVRVLHSLVTVMVRCAEPWRPPAHSKFQVARSLFMSGVTLPNFFGPSIFVDAAWDSFGFRVGGLIPHRGVRSWMVWDRITNQQEAELQVVAWAVRLA